MEGYRENDMSEDEAKVERWKWNGEIERLVDLLSEGLSAEEGGSGSGSDNEGKEGFKLCAHIKNERKIGGEVCVGER